MTAFTRMRERETRIFGTRGELRGDGAGVDVYDFLDAATTHRATRSGSEIRRATAAATTA